MREAKLRREGLVQSREAGLGGSVVGEGGGAELANDGRDIHNSSTVGGADEGRKEGLESVEGPEKVGGKGGVDFGEGKIEEGLALDNGGVVDKNSRGAELWLR